VAADGRAPQPSVRRAGRLGFTVNAITETIMSDLTDTAATADLRAAAMAAVVQCRGAHPAHKSGGVR